MNSSRLTYVTMLVGAAVWCLAIVAAPLLSHSFDIGSGDLLYRFFQPVCHQIPDRTFTLFGAPLAVCARCSSVYFAFFAGICVYPLFRDIRFPVMPPVALLLFGSMPMFLDVFSGVVGLHEVTNITRGVTGGILGVVLPFFIIPAAIEGIDGMVAIRFKFFSSQHRKGCTDA